MTRIEYEKKLSFGDVLIKPKRSTIKSRKDVNLVRKFHFQNSNKTWEGIPIISANMDTTGTFEIAKEFAKRKMLVAIHKYYSYDQWMDFYKNNKNVLNYCAISIGISEPEFEKMVKIYEQINELNFICIDVANGYSEYFVQKIQEVRKRLPKSIIMAGNVVTSEMTEELIIAGADIIKVGIGPGSACTTRKQTGVGYPQLSAVIECSDAAHGLGGYIISDGGCCVPGDFSKAFGAGADFVMAGGMFAGTAESAGEIISIPNPSGKPQLYKKFYGMSSTTAMKKHTNGVANYRSSEGKCIQLPYKGPIENIILDLLGGIRSTCTYVGAKNIKDLPKRTTFIITNIQLNTVFNKYKDLSKIEY